MIAIIIITTILIVIALIAVMNALTFPRLSPADVSVNSTFVSILIPARNEAKVIGETVRMLLAQTYVNLEIILLDDNSEDGTSELAWQAAGGDMRLQVIAGKPLPAGWLG